MMPSAVSEIADSTSQVADGDRAADSDYSGRVLAEAVGALERDRTESLDDAAANLRAQHVDGDLERRILTRAAALPVADSLRAAIHHVRAAMTWILIIAVVVVFVAGAGTARAVLGSPSTADNREPVNFFLALLGTLGIQSLILLLWLAIMLIGPRLMRSRHHPAVDVSPSVDRAALALAVASLGGIVVKAAQRLASWIHKGPLHAAAVMAVGGVNSRGPLGKWTLSAISHSLWLSFNIGCLLMVMILLGTRQYTFAWETTILSERAYVPLTRAVAALPSALRFAVPTIEQIEHSQWPGTTARPYAGADASQAWAGLLVGSIVVYGFAPRLILLGFCLGQRRAARKRFRLDTASPPFARLEPLVMPVATLIGVVDDEDDTPRPHSHATDHASTGRQRTSAAMLGLELSQQATNWPPRLTGAAFNDLGVIEGGNDQRRILQQLKSSNSEPSVLMVVASLITTPDRGIASFLQGLRESISTPVALILTGGHAMRQRGGADHIVQRIQDWRQLARSVGINDDRIVEIDLDHLTDASASQLKLLISGDREISRTGLPRRIESAFALIADSALRWTNFRTIELSQQSELHQQIAKLYQHERSPWRSLLRLPTSLTGDMPSQLRNSAARMIDLLPGRLKKSPKWLAAGAATGALACVAAASFISPIAIASLPMWSAIGAAIAAVAQQSSATKSSSSEDSSSLDIGDAVRSAALFALLLELQGRDEASITRILDRVIDDAHDDPGRTSSEIRNWLDDLRHRFDMTLARETAA